MIPAARTAPHGFVVSETASSRGLLDGAVPDLFRLAMGQAAVAMCLVGFDGRFLAVNRAVCDLLGRDADELLRLSFQELTHPDDLRADVANLEAIVRGETNSFRVHKRYLRPDSSVVHGDLSVTGIRDAAGALVACLSLIVDVTEREAALVEAAESKARLRGVIDTQIDPWVYLTAIRDEAGSIVDFAYADANDAALVANRMTREQLLGSTLLTLLPGHAGGLLAQYAAVVDTGVPLSLDDDPYASELTDGQTRWFDNRAVRIGDGVSFTWRDLTDRVRLRQRLTQEANSDPLTGLTNRAGLAAAAAATFNRSPRSGERIVVLYCDLDDLKGINDEHGHEWGDVVLRTVADRIAGAIRASDVASRVGGDEFVVIADGIADDEAAAAVATKIAEAVTRPIRHSGHQVTPTLSIGVAVADPGDDIDTVLRHADEQLYLSKQARHDGT